MLQSYDDVNLVLHNDLLLTLGKLHNVLVNQKQTRMQQDLSSLLKMELNSKNGSIYLVLWKHSDQKTVWLLIHQSYLLLSNPWYLELNKIQCSHSLPYGFSFFLTMQTLETDKNLARFPEVFFISQVIGCHQQPDVENICSFQHETKGLRISITLVHLVFWLYFRF